MTVTGRVASLFDPPMTERTAADGGAADGTSAVETENDLAAGARP